MTQKSADDGQTKFRKDVTPDEYARLEQYLDNIRLVVRKNALEMGAAESPVARLAAEHNPVCPGSYVARAIFDLIPNIPEIAEKADAIRQSASTRTMGVPEPKTTHAEDAADRQAERGPRQPGG